MRFVDLNGESPQFALTCTSTGGPATTVTWTRDSETVSGGRTVLEDPVTAQYTHTLTVTERLGGQYQCTVSNNKPSVARAKLTVQGEVCMKRSKCLKQEAIYMSLLAMSSICHCYQWFSLIYFLHNNVLMYAI